MNRWDLHDAKKAYEKWLLRKRRLCEGDPVCMNKATHIEYETGTNAPMALCDKHGLLYDHEGR
jgi:hypothetical protein